MRRAMMCVGLALCAAALMPPDRTSARVMEMNAVGLIDYSHKPEFKVGDWVQYHVTGYSVKGQRDDYLVTVIIAGEENFWGEDGFWVETWTEPKGEPPLGTVTLMSYAIFDDSLPSRRMQLYQRKSIKETDDDGEPVQVLLRRNPSSLKRRDPFDDKIAVDVDTVGADTVLTPLGLFHCVKVSFRQGKNNSHDFGDSTQYDEAWDKRMKYLSRQIPITSLARQEIDVSYQRRKWQIGRSENAPPLQYLDHSIAEARVVGFGSGMKSRILPESMQKSLPRKAAAAAPTRKARPSATKKSG